MNFTCPFRADVVDGSAVGQASSEVGFEPVVLLFESHHALEEREGGLDEHSLVPGAALAELEVGRIVLFGVEAGVSQDQHLLFKVLNLAVEGGVVSVGRPAVPAHDLAPLVEQDEELGAHNPTVVALAFARHVPLAPAFSPRVEEFNTERVAHAQSGVLCHKAFAQKVMLSQQTKQA